MTAPLEPPGPVEPSGPVLPEAPESARGWPFVVGLALGGALMAVGLVGMLVDSERADLLAVGRYVVGFAILHDAVVAPVVVVVGLVLARRPRSAGLGPVRAALALSAVVAVFSIPLVRRWGAVAGNDSTLPRAYGRNLFIVLAAIWVVAGVVVVVRRVRATTGVQPTAPNAATAAAKRDEGT